MLSFTLETIAVFVMSSLLMCLELLEIRIMAFTHWFHFIYFVIVLALIGFSVAGTVLCVESRLLKIPKKTFYAVCYLGFAVSGFLSIGFASTTATNLGGVQMTLSEGSTLSASVKQYLPLLLLLTLPFLFSSLLICRSLMGSVNSKLLYGWNLIGTAFGSLSFVLFLESLGAIRFLFVTVGIACLMIFLLRPSSKFLNLATAITLLGAFIGIASPDIFFSPALDKSKNLSGFYPERVENTRWSPLFRVDLAKTHYGRLITIDGDAQTWVYRLSPELLDSKELFVPDTKRVSRHLVFQLTPQDKRERALVIGAGGGMDVFAAKQAGFENIDAVDIDKVRLEWLKGPYSSLLSGLMNLPNIHSHAVDGRNFVMDKSKVYDAIMLYNVDSLTAMTTGAYNLSENYLYTLEAFRDYYRALSDSGLFQITRPLWGSQREVKRVLSTMLEVAISEDQDLHGRIAILTNGKQLDFVYSKGGFTRPQIINVTKLLSLNSEGSYSVLFSDLFPEQSNSELLQLFQAAVSGRLFEKIDSSEDNFRAVTDNKPFFFEYRRWSKLIENPGAFLTGLSSNNWGGVVLGVCILMSLAVVAFLLFYGLVGMKTRPTPQATYFSVLMFSSIGLGYMMIQISLIQRFTLVIGNPILSMAVVIPTLLASMGFSSMFLSEYAIANRRRMFLFVTLSVLIICSYFLAFRQEPLYLLAGGSLLLRVSSIIGILLPLGMALGLFFPLSITLLSGKDEAAVPIAWTANGGASVLGSLAGVLLALIFGFSNVYLLAIAFYIFAGFLLMKRYTHTRAFT